MIVREPPYDLIALFADLEMQKLCEALIERGQEPARHCIRPIRWRSLRDPRRDTVWREPDRALRPFLHSSASFLVVWDFHGSGAEAQSAHKTERKVVDKLTGAGVPADQVLAVAVQPELEAFFAPVWKRVKKIVSSERSLEPPTDIEILRAACRSLPVKEAPKALDGALQEYPKEMFEALVRLVRLRRTAPLYQKIGAQVSLPGLKKGSTVSHIVAQIQKWFPLNA